MSELVTQNISRVESQSHSSPAEGPHDGEGTELMELERDEEAAEVAISDRSSKRHLPKTQKWRKSGREQLGMTRSVTTRLFDHQSFIFCFFAEH